MTAAIECLEQRPAKKARVIAALSEQHRLTNRAEWDVTLFLVRSTALVMFSVNQSTVKQPNQEKRHQNTK